MTLTLCDATFCRSTQYVFAVFNKVAVPILASVRKYIYTVQQDFGKQINDRVDMKTVFCCSWFRAEFYGFHIHVLLCFTALIVAEKKTRYPYLALIERKHIKMRGPRKIMAFSNATCTYIFNYMFFVHGVNICYDNSNIFSN